MKLLSRIVQVLLLIQGLFLTFYGCTAPDLTQTLGLWGLAVLSFLIMSKLP